MEETRPFGGKYETVRSNNIESFYPLIKHGNIAKYLRFAQVVELNVEVFWFRVLFTSDMDENLQRKLLVDG